MSHKHPVRPCTIFDEFYCYILAEFFRTINRGFQCVEKFKKHLKPNTSKTRNTICINLSFTFHMFKEPFFYYLTGY